MGIVNVTPDSFSDGGKFFDADRAVAQALQLVAAGADLLDVGGESTRPDATPVAAEEELRRVLPVVAQICAATRVPVSIDTSKADVAERCVGLGAEVINDVTALTGDPRMIRVATETGAAVCAMHMQGTPQTMQLRPEYDDVVQEVMDYLRERRETLTRAGIDPERICLDPGIGFGKTHAHNLTLLRQIARFHALGSPLLVGHSRKGFLAHVLRDKAADRTAATVGVALGLALRQVQVLRVHDVQAVRHALQLFEAVGGLDGLESRS
jgi:dihydropteroate synthase